MTTLPNVGEPAPAFSLKNQDDQRVSLDDFGDRWLVLYFYPKDNTPGCTQEGKDFADVYDKFQSANTEIVGVSKDSIKKHSNFIEKYGFPFDLIADTEEELCQALDVIKEKSMYGKKFMGIERSTFIFDEQGRLTHEFRKVKVKGHVEEVLKIVS